MKKLGKLTTEQEELMNTVAQEWIDIALGEGQYIEEKIVQGVKWLYQLSDLKEPLVLVVDSPLACQLVANSTNNVCDKVGDKVRDKIKDKVIDKVWDKIKDKVWDKVGDKVIDKVWDKVWVKVGDKVIDKVRAKVWDKVRDKIKDKVWDKDLEFFSFSYDELIWCAGWISFYDFFQKIGILKDKQFSNYKESLKAGNFMSIYLDGLAIVSLPPKRVEWLENNLHSLNGPAIVFQDGFEIFYINDVEFEEELYWKIIKREISAKEVIELRNVEQRTIALETLGYDSVLRELKGKILHSQPSPNFPEKTEQVIEIDLNDDDGVKARFLKFVDYSTGKEGVLRVDARDKSTKTVRGADEWTRKKPEKENYVIVRRT